LETKLEILKDVDNREEYDKIVQKYGLKNKSTISDIVRQMEKLLGLSVNLDKKSLKSVKRNRVSNYEDLDKALYLWFEATRRQGADITGHILRAQALYFAEQLNLNNFKGSNGFIDGFVKRHNIKFNTKSGESESVSEETIEQWKSSVKEIISSYEAKDIIYLDETGIFWRLMQSKTYAMSGESTKGHKKCKDRVTAVLIVNADGSERHLVVIGKSKSPRCFKGIKNLPIFSYYYNSTAWMTSDLFKVLMTKLDNNYRKQNRNVLLILDNCPSHPNLNLTNIKLLFLPPNSTSRTQPLDAGIIRSFKQRYRNKFLQYIIERLKPDLNCENVIKNVNLLNAIHFMSFSLKDIPISVFQNCFKCCGI
jgi:hypothetical protein